MDNRKIILASYLAVAMLTWFLTRSAVNFFDQQFWQVQRFFRMLPGRDYVKEAIPFLLGVATFFVLFTKTSINTFMEEVVAEIRKVTWPGKQEVVRSTIVVIGCIIVASIVLGFYDLVWGHVVSFVLG